MQARGEGARGAGGAAGLAAALLWGGCGVGAPALPLPPGRWALDPVEGAVLAGRPAAAPLLGQLEVPSDGGPPLVEVAGGALLTEGLVPVLVEGPTDGEGDGVRWLRFPVLTPMGAGEAALRIEGQRGRMPLGGRPGEHDQDLRLRAGPPDPALAAARATAAAAQRTWSEAWAAGLLELVDADDAAVGDLAFFPDGGVRVDLYDAGWSTGGPRAAQRADDGADLLLAVPVEPSLDGEGALLRVNLVHQVVVVPSAEQPQPEDRWLRLRPGGPDPGARVARHAAAAAAALEAEAGWLRAALPKLAAAGESPLGCRPMTALGGEWALLLRGYDARFIEERGGCTAVVEPAPPQHGRRTRGRARADGWVELQPVADLGEAAPGLVGPAAGR